jgi:DNA-binding LytR/AlgR family response regulator
MTDHTHHTVTLNIGSLEEKLPVGKFIRANRSLLLNISYLQQVDKSKRICILKYGEKEVSIPLSVSKIRKLEKLLDERVK